MKRCLSVFLTIFMLLTICCLPAAAAPALLNVALGKPASASSEWGGGYLISCINDGKYNTAWSAGSTLLNPRTKEGYQWIMIDLGANYDISSMIAYSRSDVNSSTERIGWQYQVAEKADFSDMVTIGQKNAPGSPGSGYEVSLKEAVTARYVRVAMVRNVR